MNKITLLTKGIFLENPLLVLSLGLVPALLGAKTGELGLALGVCTFIILLITSILMSLIKKQIMDKTEKIIIIALTAGITTVVSLHLQAYNPELYAELNVALPLIAINCILIETLSFYPRNYTFIESTLNSIGVGIGYIWALALMGSIREILALGTLWGKQIIPIVPLEGETFFLLVPGGLIILAILMAFVHWITNKIKRRSKGIWQ